MYEHLMHEIQETYGKLSCLLIKNNITVSTMESCTSGLIASLLTDTEGASAIFPGALVTYCNEQKIANGVPKEVIDNSTVYSEETAAGMAKAAAERFKTDLAIGVTGCFGNPDPANASGRPGTVYYAVCFRDDVKTGKITLAADLSRQESKLETARKTAEAVFRLLGEEIL